MGCSLHLATLPSIALTFFSPLPSPDRNAAPYALQPLVTLSSPISDLPGGKLVEIGGLFPRAAGELAFWGKLAGREEKVAWALFSWQEGRIRTVLEEGTEVTSRYAEPAFRFNVHRSIGKYARLEPRNGKWLYFTHTPPHFLPRDMGVFGWDGLRIRPILLPGQTVHVRGQELPVEWAVLRDVDPDGNGILEAATKEFRVHLRHDGTALRELFPQQLTLEGGEVLAGEAIKSWKPLPNGELLAHLDTGSRTGIGPVLHGDFPGVLVRHYLGPGPLPKNDTIKEFPFSFLDLANLDAGLQPPPDVPLADGRTLNLGTLIEWPGSDGNLIRLPDGLYRLERGGATSPERKTMNRSLRIAGAYCDLEPKYALKGFYRGPQSIRGQSRNRRHFPSLSLRRICR